MPNCVSNALLISGEAETIAEVTAALDSAMSKGAIPCDVALRSPTRLGLTFETAWMAPTGLYAALRSRYGVRLDALAIYEGDTRSDGWDVIAEDTGVLPDLVTIKDVLDEGGNPIGMRACHISHTDDYQSKDEPMTYPNPDALATTPFSHTLDDVPAPAGPQTIIVDIDNTIANYVFATLRAAHDLRIPVALIDRVETYALYPVPFATYDDWFAAHTRALADTHNMVPLDVEAGRATRRLRAAGHTVVIATSRTPDTERATRAYLTSHEIDFDDLVFTSDKHLLGGDIIFDDNPQTLSLCRAAGMTVILSLIHI